MTTGTIVLLILKLHDVYSHVRMDIVDDVFSHVGIDIVYDGLYRIYCYLSVCARKKSNFLVQS
jgi:hypothetical protein